jgi:small-conductance mechanosensitive channel
MLVTAVRVGAIAVVALLIHRIVLLLLRRFERRVALPHDLSHAEHAKRARTLASLIHNVVTVMIVTTGVLMILRELEVDITPILASAGIVGLAVGFGAQTLVKDVIAGFFLILEDQIRVGDVADINGVGGVVEVIHLRTVVLRDLHGAAHVFPCGSIAKIANLTKDYAFAVIDAHVSHANDADNVIASLTTVGRELRLDARWQADVIDDVEVLGIETFGDTGFTVRIRMKTIPHRQWDVARELRLRIMRAFRLEGIEIPAPPKVVVARPGAAPEPVAPPAMPPPSVE